MAELRKELAKEEEADIGVGSVDNMTGSQFLINGLELEEHRYAATYYSANAAY